MAAFVTIDRDGLVVSIQRFEIDAPDFRPQQGDALRLMQAYWKVVAIATLGLVRLCSRPDGFALELRGLGLPLLAFGPPWLLESEGFVGWAVALRGGLLNAGAGGSFVCAARRRGERWYFTLALRGFAPRIAGLWPTLLWRPFYRWTQGTIHHLIGVVYLTRWGRSLVLPTR